jgi:hypothetical protein
MRPELFYGFADRGVFVRPILMQVAAEKLP